MHDLFEQYEIQIQPARDTFLARFTPLFAEKDSKVLSLFLIHFTSLGVGMTEPVSDWIRRAGEKTKKMGFDSLGQALVEHANHEEGHHRMMIADTKSLVAYWNDFYSPKLNAEFFLSRPWSQGVESYRRLHEDTISGDKPYGQIAIEYEIEKVSVDHGPKLFGHVIQILGMDVLKCLSFIMEHTAIDVGHTQYNQRALSSFLEVAPTTIASLVLAGKNALNCYAAYLENCVILSREFLKENE